MDKQKKQHKPIVCRKHTIIERERLLAHEDIINDTQYSGKGEGTQIVAYWKDEDTGETLVSDAYSKGKLKGSGWYFPTALEQPEVPVYNWTPNYTGQGYVEIPEWHGVAGDVIELEFNCNYVNTWNPLIMRVGIGGYLQLDPQNDFGFLSSVGRLYIDDAEVIAGQKYIGGEVRVRIDITSDFYVQMIASNNKTLSNFFNGTIKNIRLTKADGSDNRFYESAIKSETEPETLVLEDSISGNHGTLKNFPENAVWKEVTTQLPVGEHTLKDGELISFTRDSYAWLDGVEYAPNEPRYTKDGELLVEGQATNLYYSMPTQDLEYITFIDGKRWITSKGEGGQIFVTALKGSNMTANIPHVVSFTINKDHLDSGYGGRAIGINSGTFPPFSGAVYSQTKLGTRVSIPFTPDQTSVNVYLYPSTTQAEEPTPLMYTDFQVESGTVATSFIQSTATTAVTRAADIAIVRSIN